MYFLDALYGKIELNIPIEVLITPELQRLREIRLCNINSPFITGGTSLNRFEHAIGTAYLAQEIIKVHTKDKSDQTAFIIAALLHDIVTAPFGHSLEYLYESIGNKEYEHANIWQMIFTGRTIPSSRNIFCGKKTSLQFAIEPKILKKVQSLLERNHQLSYLLVNDIDIDNIDNVFRFAFHIGLSLDKSLPLNLAKALKYNGQLSVPSEWLIYFEQWFEVRKQLYKYLLENEGEFVAKALLERAFIECFKENLISEYDWVLTDAEIIKYIITEGNEIAKKCIQRLMLMDFPKYKKVFYICDYKKVDRIFDKLKLDIVDFAFKNDVLLHFIRDVNKTCRRLSINVSDKNKDMYVGELNDRYLVGMFSENLSSINNIESYLKKELKFDLVNIKGDGRDEIQASFL